MATKFLEKNLEDIIFEADKDELSDRGLDIYGKIYRQFDLGKYGIADLVEFYKYIEEEKTCDESTDYLVTVYELKRGEIDFSTFAQALRYVNGLIIKNKNEYPKIKCQYKIVLIGSKLTNKDEFKSFPELISPTFTMREDPDKVIGIELYEYSYGINGINFKKNDYYLKEEINKII